MSNADKNILITTNRGSTTADPRIDFVGANSTTAGQTISLNVLPISNGTLSFEGSAGQLFSITNDLTGTIFSVNDVSGIPSIEVDADGTVRFAKFSGNVLIGTAINDGTNKLQVSGAVSATRFVSVAGSVTVPAFSTSSDTNTGIYFSAADTVNITTGGTLAATFAANGNFTAVGEVTAFSDTRLKDNVEVIADPLIKILSIRGVTFTRTDQADLGRKHMGVIAQEVEQYFPEVVHTTEDGTKTVNYGAMAGAFIEAFKAQQSQIDELRTAIEKLLDK